MVDDQKASLVEAAARSHQLRNNIFADTVLFEHSMDAADLTFDPAQPREDCFRLNVRLFGCPLFLH